VGAKPLLTPARKRPWRIRRTRYRRPDTPLRALLRFVASVLITSGVLMLLDAGLTVVWQEPISSYLANREQDRLGEELDGQGDELARDKLSVAELRDLRRRLARLAQLQERRSREGRPIGRIEIPSLDGRYVVVQGIQMGTLRKGPGHYPGTSFPGQGGTVAIAGHRTTYLAPFRDVDDLERGEPVVLSMPYGRFTYEVERTRIVEPQQTEVIRPVRGAERLVLTACHPLYSAAQRIVVFARLSRFEGA
jgi:sortase A